MNHELIASITKTWLTSVVVELNLCPFANREIVNERVRFAVTAAESENALLEELEAELNLVNSHDSIETTLLIHPHVLQKFADYNQFLDLAEELLRLKGFEGIYQIASFHPAYQFSQTNVEDVENYSNRSPFPMLHLINEESIAVALENYPGSGRIPQRNIRLLQNLGRAKLKTMFQACFEPTDK